MSISRLYLMYCDGGDECPRNEPGEDMPFDPCTTDTISEQRRKAKTHGWQIGRASCRERV